MSFMRNLPQLQSKNFDNRSNLVFEKEMMKIWFPMTVLIPQQRLLLKLILHDFHDCFKELSSSNKETVSVRHAIYEQFLGECTTFQQSKQLAT